MSVVQSWMSYLVSKKGGGGSGCGGITVPTAHCYHNITISTY